MTIKPQQCASCSATWADGSVRALLGKGNQPDGTNLCKRCERKKVNYGVGKERQRGADPSPSRARGSESREREAWEASREASRSANRRFGSEIVRRDAERQSASGYQRGNGSTDEGT